MRQPHENDEKRHDEKRHDEKRHVEKSGRLKDEICETDSLAKGQQKAADADRLRRRPAGSGVSLPIPFFRN